MIGPLEMSLYAVLVMLGLGAAMALVAGVIKGSFWLTVYMIRFAALAIMTGLPYLLHHISRILAGALAWLWGFVHRIVAGRHEWRGKAPPDDEAEDEPDDTSKPDTPINPIEAARLLLGLPADYTRAALISAYRQAIAKAHPDKGGAVQDAQALNTARDRLLKARGWR